MEPLPTKVLGTRIHELRQAAGLSLRELGARLSDGMDEPPISAAFLSDIENGKRYPSLDLIDRMAEVLGADRNELKNSDPRPPTREIQDLIMIFPQFAFAFRQAIDIIRRDMLTPETFLRRLEGEYVPPVDPSLFRVVCPEDEVEPSPAPVVTPAPEGSVIESPGFTVIPEDEAAPPQS